ncbi:MAG TPA: HNH endonuclease signature motif containing protein [Microbacterium sp.]|uniref:HNH endonuclease signature motif containing protein n=1 Tax=Microbacterium sp. TaxID=51671 RepID=UPI002C0174BE|nr:HNH endonuclease signature motif containing protein [Microbacterium sp.]HWI31122.1 HNH endonuclease signature motif containing protein [Microbacterium sp.]
MEGIGPIPTSRARELCGGADGWMRILTHPETGMVLSVGREQYRPPPALRRLVRWRADRCMAPGCGVPAARCEIDHTIAWQDGGDTALENSAPLCKGHHAVKHHGGWRVGQVEGSGGALEWTSPTGRRYLVAPERRVPVFRPHTERDAPF